jgi:hypothetical protein
MKAPKRIGLVLLFVAGSTMPVSANWFANPYLGINRNIGSAPNPTPQQLRQERSVEDQIFAYDNARRAQNPYSWTTSQTGSYYRQYGQPATDLNPVYAQANRSVTVYGPWWSF